MKIIRDDVIYIQLKDIDLLLRLNDCVPVEFSDYIRSDRFFIDETNRKNFIGFNRPSTLFLLNYIDDFILDLDKCYNMHFDDFKRLRILNYKDYSNDFVSCEESLKMHILKEKHRLEDYEDIKKIRNGKSDLKLPVELEKRNKPKTLRLK